MIPGMGPKAPQIWFSLTDTTNHGAPIQVIGQFECFWRKM
jgi:hypothetical protein